MVTARIQSNHQVHGLHFAIESEYKRLLRAGRSKRVAYLMAVEMVGAVIPH